MTLRAGAKVLTGLIALLIISILIGGYSLYSINKYSMSLEEQAKIHAARSSITAALTQHYSWRGDLTIAVLSGTEFTGTYNPDDCPFGTWLNSGSGTIGDNNILSLLKQIDEPHRFIHTEAKNVMAIYKDGDADKAQKELVESILPKANMVISLLGEIGDQYDVILDNQTKIANDFKDKTIIVFIELLVLITILFVFLVYSLKKRKG